MYLTIAEATVGTSTTLIGDVTAGFTLVFGQRYAVACGCPMNSGATIKNYPVDRNGTSAPLHSPCVFPDHLAATRLRDPQVSAV